MSNGSFKRWKKLPLGKFYNCIFFTFVSNSKMFHSKIEKAYNNIQRRVKKGLAYEHAWNETSVELASAADMHCRANVLAIFQDKVQSSKPTLSKELGVVLQQLLELYSVFIAIRFSGDLLRVNKPSHFESLP